jgi:hypothetical protein
MQTGLREDQATAHLQQLQAQRPKRQNGKKNGMLKSAKTQLNPLYFSKESNMPEYSPLQEVVCNQSTMPMGAVTESTLPSKAVKVSSPNLR